MSSSKQALELPHERDERTESPGPVKRVMVQAATDLETGLVDTDNYTRAATVAAGGEKRRHARRVPRKAGR